MKNSTLALIFSLAILFNSCEQDVIPVAVFDTDFATDYSYLQSNKSNIPRYATFEPVKFINKGRDGVKCSWDFGNGEFSTDWEPVMHYQSGGEYSVTLTIESETGNKSSITKTIKIYERVIDRITINFSGWGYNLYSLDELGWTKDRVGDILLEVGILGAEDFLNPSTILFTSDTIKNVSIESQEISFTPQEDIQIDYNLLFVSDEPRPAYVILLYSIDNGIKRLFYSSEYFPGMTSYLDADSGLYKIESGTIIDVECVFK